MSEATAEGFFPRRRARAKRSLRDFANDIRYRWERTDVAKKRWDKDEDGHYQGRRIIDRDSRVDKGVWLGGGREALVVDFDKDEYLKGLYGQIMKKMEKRYGRFRKSKALRLVYDEVDAAFPKRKHGQVESFIKEQVYQPGIKVYLGNFIVGRTGECRHMALACAAILEKMGDEGHLGGTARVNRNSQEKGVHGWCRYTTGTGVPYILDVAERYFGSLEESRGSASWDYFKPGDK